MTMASDGLTEQISHVGNRSLEPQHEREKKRGAREIGKKMVQNRWRGSFK